VTAKPISFEVFSDEFPEMKRQALKIAAWQKNVYVKIPITNTRGESSLPLVQELGKQGVQLNITAILTLQPTIQFAGLMQPVSTLEGSAKFIGSIWPTSYYMHSSVGAYTKGLAPALMVKDFVVLAVSIPILLGLSMLRLKKQEK
jgi:hypothetical protein